MTARTSRKRPKIPEMPIDSDTLDLTDVQEYDRETSLKKTRMRRQYNRQPPSQLTSPGVEIRCGVYLTRELKEAAMALGDGSFRKGVQRAIVLATGVVEQIEVGDFIDFLIERYRKKNDKSSGKRG